MAAAGHRRVLALATSAYSSYSGCRQYLEDIERARAAVGSGAPRIDKVPPFGAEERFVAVLLARLNEILPQLSQDAVVLFTAHSIPLSMAQVCAYRTELETVARRLGENAGGRQWALVYQSRSGPPSQPWLEPDVCDEITALAARGTREIGILPIGFVSDHMEVIYDLDVLAAERAQALGMQMVRGATVGTHADFVALLADLIMRALSSHEVKACPVGCCLAPPMQH
jgi:ferrochelatase